MFSRAPYLTATAAPSGRGTPPRRAPRADSLSASRKPLHEGRGFFDFRKTARRAVFTILLFALTATAAHAAEETRQIVTLDVVGGGALGALVAALIAWLNGQRRAPRNPPLGEDTARTYATKADLADLDKRVVADIASLRASVAENDAKAENRARGTHARIDTLYKESQRTNKSLGMLIGIMLGRGNTAAAAAINEATGGE